MNYGTTPKKEKHPRIPVEDVDVTQYYALVNKMIRGYARSYGQIITDNYEEFFSAGIVGLLKAKRDYDPTRGTFVTIAYRKVFTAVHNLYVSLSKERGRMDLSTSEQLEAMEMTSTDFTKRVVINHGFSANFEVVGELLMGVHKKLYWCLYNGLTKQRACVVCDIHPDDYDTVCQELKEEILEITTQLYGGRRL